VGVQGSRTAAAPGAPTTTEQRAQAVVDYAVTSVPLPAGSHPVGPVVGIGAGQPAPRGAGVHRTAWFSAPAGPEAVGNWILGHGWDNGWNPSMTIGSGRVTMVLAWFGLPEDVVTADPLLHVRVVPGGRGSIVRVDGWQQPQDVPARSAETVLGVGVTSVSLVRGGQSEDGAYRSTLTLTYHGAQVRRLVRALDALPLSWAVDGRQCVTSSNVTLTFHRAGHTVVFVDAPACGFVRVKVDGKAEPPLTALDLPLQQAVSALRGF
jgi:hypothetical protein